MYLYLMLKESHTERVFSVSNVHGLVFHVRYLGTILAMKKLISSHFQVTSSQVMEEEEMRMDMFGSQVLLCRFFIDTFSFK